MVLDEGMYGGTEVMTSRRQRLGGKQRDCSVCGRVCNDNWELNLHMHTHTGERPFKCPHCPLAFTQSGNLYRHRRKIHKDNI